MKFTLLSILFFFFVIISHGQTVTDVDGNVYNTITIGFQTWMQENLKVTHYNNGDSIGTTSPPTLDINGELSPKYQWAYEGIEQYADVFGRLYTWYAATDPRELCPDGWHLPSDGEWIILRDYLANHGYGYGGMIYYIAKSMATTTLWLTDTMPGSIGYDLESNNSSGFSGMPGGVRNGLYSYFTNVYWGTKWWSSTLDATQNAAWAHGLFKRYGYMQRDPTYLHAGFAVRCVKDFATKTFDTVEELKFKIYPNPAADILYVEIIGGQNTKLQIINLIGQSLLEEELKSPLTEINISPLPSGIYTVRLSGKFGILSRWLTKE